MAYKLTAHRKAYVSSQIDGNPSHRNKCTYTLYHYTQGCHCSIVLSGPEPETKFPILVEWLNAFQVYPLWNIPQLL